VGRRPGPVVFEHQSDGPLIVYGRMTGIRYHWPGPGARLQVDARDAPYLEVVRGLKRVQRKT
jgi:hypothetical protein